MATTKTAQEQIAELQAKIKELQQQELAEIEAEYAQVSARATELRNRIAEIRGEPAERGRGRGRQPKKEGIRVSADRLKELISQAEGKELNLRRGGYDTGQIKKIIAENPGVFKLGGKNPWPTVSLAGKK